MNQFYQKLSALKKLLNQRSTFNFVEPHVLNTIAFAINNNLTTLHFLQFLLDRFHKTDKQLLPLLLWQLVEFWDSWTEVRRVDFSCSSVKAACVAERFVLIFSKRSAAKLRQTLWEGHAICVLGKASDGL